MTKFKQNDRVKIVDTPKGCEKYKGQTAIVMKKGGTWADDERVHIKIATGIHPDGDSLVFAPEHLVHIND